MSRFIDLFNLLNNKGITFRNFIMAAYMGGLTGLPALFNNFWVEIAVLI